MASVVPERFTSQASAAACPSGREVFLEDPDLVAAVASADPHGVPAVGPAVPIEGGEPAEANAGDVLFPHRVSASGKDL